MFKFDSGLGFTRVPHSASMMSCTNNISISASSTEFPHCRVFNDRRLEGLSP
jgi:hypothetical protein